MKRHRKRNSKNSTDLLVRIKNLEDELFNLRRAYSLNHSQLNPLNIRRIKASDKFQRQAYGYTKNLVEKCGFVEEGRDRMGSYINGKYCTDIYMGILKSEYSPIPDRGDFE